MMKHKPAFFVSAALSVFILATLAGVLSFVAKPAEAGTSSQASQDVAQLLADQQAAYTQVINDANQRLTDAQAAIDSMQGASSSTSAESAAIPSEEAAQIASLVAAGSNAPQTAPELVDFEGSMAYEVVFDAGNIYVDAISGAVLYNGTINVVPADISAERAAQLAAAYMGNNDIYKVELLTLNGQDVYRVKFLNGDAVFVGLKGDILLVRLATSVETASNSNGEREHEEHEEHEEHDDD
jgi:uncharacterized membrane protein YkoI